MISQNTFRSSLVAGVLASLGATACCVLPLVFVSLGLGGAWLASLRSLESLQPVFAAVTFICLGSAFYYAYVQPKRCDPGDPCASPHVLKRQRMILWLVVAGIVALGVFYSFIGLLE